MKKRESALWNTVKVMCMECECAAPYNSGMFPFTCRKRAPWPLMTERQEPWPLVKIDDWCMEGVKKEKEKEKETVCPACLGTNKEGILKFYPTAPAFSHLLQIEPYKKSLYDALLHQGNNIVAVVEPCPVCGRKEK